MSYTLILGPRTYSSWSLRGWLLFERFGIPCQATFIDFGKDIGAQMAPYAPAKTVPTMITPDAVAVSDSLAITEELASRFPDAGLWPDDPAARAMARTLAAEMHSGMATFADAGVSEKS